MAKAASPVRLQEELMEAATITGKQLHRSAAEQVEYWASIGRKVSKVINPDILLAVSAGLAKVKVEDVVTPTINPEDVFADLERKRSNGSLTKSIMKNTNKPYYQASTTQPGQLEQIDHDGTIIIGQFNNGQFIPSA